MIVTQDERTAARFEASYPIQIEANGRPIPGRSLNMGIGGICLEPGDALPDRTPVVCRLDADGRPLEAQGEVAWQYAEDGVYRMGIRFCALSPAMAGWLSTVSVSHTAVAQTHEPLSDTQPMKVPVDPEDFAAEMSPPAEAAAVEPAPVHPAKIEQLPLWKPGAAPEPVAEAVETDVLFDDMPSPEARMMQSRADAKSVEAMSGKHRLAAMVGALRGKLVTVAGKVAAPIARLRKRGVSDERKARTERIATASPSVRVPLPAVGSIAARLRLPVIVAFVRSMATRAPRVGKHLQSRRVQLIVAASAVTLLIGSGVAFLFAGGDEAGAGDAPVAELPAPSDNGGSYWDPPAMPVPDQEIAEAAPVPAPEPAPEPRRRAARQAEPPPVAIPDMPLPEPPVVGAEAEEPTAPAVAAAEVPPELPAPGEPGAAPAEEPVRGGATAEAAGSEARERRRGRREERAARAREADRRRADREEARPTQREGEERPSRGREPPPTREPAAREQHAAARPAAARPAAPGAAAGPTTFRLNLSGAPGPIHTYPLANPNGIVIDVANLQHPGAATKLTSDDPRIRFVKIINREQGVRFIVYLNGALPEYEITPSGRGVRVALRD